MDVVPLDIDAGVQITRPVLSDMIVFFEGISKVVGMAVTYVFNTKVVGDEAEEDRAPFVAPNTRSGCTLAVYVLGWAFFEELVDEDARLGEDVDTTVDSEIDPTILDKVNKVVFVNEVLINVGEIDANIFGTV